ncbi:hypothetical protein QNH09_gp55 [Aeromonas phage PVN03]|uniref:Uncharacterized protein n=1 Tax=Aeromonas phage PVN03 TaxID=2822864 RepID=A0AAE7RA91_9CAUD|nr:hypothetical protein QNH09_gp55 [Aeromonas phage PVN03]QTQ06837.1 hypothetical protein [Aeromonas phage PVN03]
MQVKNTTKGYISFAVRLNAGEKVTGYDAHGNEIRKDALPQIRTVTIPPLATVELEDKLWRLAVKATSRRQRVALSKDPVQIGSDNKNAKAEHFITTPVGDGVFKSFNPVMDRVKRGDLQIVEAPKSDLTLEQMRAAIEEAQGYPMPKEVAEDLVIAQYNRICE